MTVRTIGPTGIEPTGPAETSVVRGRQGWTVPCISHNTTPPTKLTLTFDAATGVVIGRNAGARYNTVELSDLALDEDFDQALFDWQPESFHDATAAARDEQHTREEHIAALAAVPASIPAYWPGGGQITHHAHDGDTATWSLLGALRRDGLDVADMQRWPARMRRPFPAPSDPGHFTWTDESWTYVIAPRRQLAADEIERIKSSITTLDRPQSLGEVVDAAHEKAAQPAVIAGAATIFAGPAQVSSHALYFTTAPDYLIPSVDGEPFRGQTNGWIGAAMAPVLEFATGLHSGTVDLEIRLEPTAPPLDLEQWDDVVEVPFSTDTTQIILSSFDGEIAKLNIPLGRYRIRLSANGVDAAHDADTGAGIDRYQLLLWPDESRPDEIIKQTSAQVAYYHRTYGGSQRTQ